MTEIQANQANAIRRHGRHALEIFEVLRADIISGALPANSTLRQEYLARRFGVSRMPVRDALRRLEAEGLITFEPNKGATVAALGFDDLREIYEMRIAAETLALRLALPEISNAQIDRAEEVQKRLEQAPISLFGELNAAFHKALYLPCDRPRLMAHIEVLNNAADRYLRIAIGALDHAERSHREHHALLEACRKRDEPAATACLAGHIEVAGKALGELLAHGERRSIAMP